MTIKSWIKEKKHRTSLREPERSSCTNFTLNHLLNHLDTLNHLLNSVADPGQAVVVGITLAPPSYAVSALRPEVRVVISTLSTGLLSKFKPIPCFHSGYYDNGTATVDLTVKHSVKLNGTASRKFGISTPRLGWTRQVIKDLDISQMTIPLFPHNVRFSSVSFPCFSFVGCLGPKFSAAEFHCARCLCRVPNGRHLLQRLSGL